MFEVDTADKRKKKRFKMIWTKNMTEKSEAIITNTDDGEEYTKITFKPDFRKFGMDRLEGDIIHLMKKRVIIYFISCNFI